MHSNNLFTRIASAFSATALLAVGITATAAPTDTKAKLLIVSQPSGPATQKSFVDIGLMLQTSLEATGRFVAYNYAPSMPELHDALGDHSLTVADITSPLSDAAIHKIAKIIGVDQILRVSGHSDKAGIIVDTTVETQQSQGVWSTQAVNRFDPPKTGKKESLGQAVRARIDSIVERLTGAPAPKNPANATTPTPGGKDNGKTADKTVGKTNPAPNANANAASANNGASGNQPDVNTYAVEIERAQRSGDTASLVTYLRRAVTADPTNLELRRKLAQAYSARGATDAALDEAQRAAAINPNDAELHRVVGDAYLDNGKPDKAIKEYLRAIEINPRNAQYLVALGDAYWNSTKTEEAVKTYEAAIKLDPKVIDPHYRLANLYVQRRRYADATLELKAAAEATPADDKTAYNKQIGPLLATIATSLSDVVTRMQATRKGFMDGANTREVAFQAHNDYKKQTEDISTFLDNLAAGSFTKPQAMLSQAASLLTQSSESMLQFLETQNTSDSDQAALLRIEANKQIGEAKALITSITAPKTPR